MFPKKSLTLLLLPSDHRMRPCDVFLQRDGGFMADDIVGLPAHGVYGAAAYCIDSDHPLSTHVRENDKEQSCDELRQQVLRQADVIQVLERKIDAALALIAVFRQESGVNCRAKI